MNMIRRLAAACAVGASVLGFSLPPGRAATTEDRLAALREQVVRGVEKFKQDEMGPPPTPEIRHLSDAGASILALGEDPKIAESYFRLGLSYQNMDAKSPDYGKVLWRVGHPEIQDNNSIEFTIATMAPAILRYGDKLSDEFRQEMVPHLRAAVAAIRNHQVPVGYTNIYLMKLANLMMLGEILHDPSAIADGKANLDSWMSFTGTNGVTEYDSPTYSTIQLVDLEDVYLEAPDPETKAKAKAALDYLWSDLAGNYFPGRGSLGGPHSRSYDFLFQQGSLQHHFYMEGLADSLADASFLGGVWLNAVHPADYHPSQGILDLAHIPERVVQQRFGPEPGRDRYNYITPDFDIGSSSAYYGPQDEAISAEFASAKKLPVVSVVVDAFDAPFGLSKTLDKSGHLKPKHLREVIAAVQEKGTILELHDLSTDLPHTRSESIATNVILPVKADALYLNGRRLNGNAPFDIPTDNKSTVCMREGNAALAVRIFAADGCEGKPAELAVKYDGNTTGAGRLVAYHYRGAPARLSDTPVRAGVFLEMEHCGSDDEFAAFMERADNVQIMEANAGDIWSASVDYGGTHLSAGLNVKTKGIAFRKVDGQDVERPVLSINGKNVTLGQLPTNGNAN